MEDFIFPAIKWQERIITRKQKKVVYKFFIKKEIEIDVESHTLIELSTTLRKKWLGKWYLIKFYQSAEITPYIKKEHARHQLWQKLIHDVYLLFLIIQMIFLPLLHCHTNYNPSNSSYYFCFEKLPKKCNLFLLFL